MNAPDLLELAIEWLKSEYPNSVIVPELSVADWGAALIDVAAITDEEIIGIEIKGDGDSPTRLELQGLRYGQVARKMWLLPTPNGTLADRCQKKKPTGWGTLEVVSGIVRPKNTAMKLGPVEKTDYGTRQPMVPDPDAYRPDTVSDSQQFNPWAICGTLWRDELHAIAQLQGMNPGSKARVHDLTMSLIERMPVPELHDAMICQLRNRQWGRKKVFDLRVADDGRTHPNRKTPNRPIQGDFLRGV